MNSSINEVAALAKKAAKGAGYSWSMADEASFATAWLCRNGIDGASALAQHLDIINERNADTLKLNSLDAPWCGGPHGLCSVSAGAALSDSANEFSANSSEISGELMQVVSPVLLLPFIAYACHQVAKQHLSQPKSASDDMCEALVNCELFNAKLMANAQGSWVSTFQITSNTFAGPSTTAYTIQLKRADKLNTAPSQTEHRVNIASDVLKTLNDYAARTYAPATDASRDGAGAGTSDND